MLVIRKGGRTVLMARQLFNQWSRMDSNHHSLRSRLLYRQAGLPTPNTTQRPRQDSNLQPAS